jgi:fructose-1-phosphate kinase PfkB-like protein
MAGKIINRVSNSQLITIDLTDYAPNVSIKELDIKDFLFQGIVLKEKEFRVNLKEFDFSNYTNKTVALNCSADAIVPMWAFMLVTSYLNSVNADIHFGIKEDVFQQIFTANINAINASKFEGKKVIVKGCGEILLTEALYIAITKKLQNTVSSLMFGEACSAVPIFKKK